MGRILAIALLLVAGVPVRAQDVPFEYTVKAAFLYNFAKYVEWPTASTQGPLTICVAGRNVFGDVLENTVRDETVGTRQIRTRVILEPEPGCHILFVPEGAAASAYLRASRNEPTLTVGETRTFLPGGGIISFFIDDGKVRFEINPRAAERAQLRLSSRLLQLARISPGETR